MRLQTRTGNVSQRTSLSSWYLNWSANAILTIFMSLSVRGINFDSIKLSFPLFHTFGIHPWMNISTATSGDMSIVKLSPDFVWNMSFSNFLSISINQPMGTRTGHCVMNNYGIFTKYEISAHSFFPVVLSPSEFSKSSSAVPTPFPL